ncbi:MAG: hypothetical protein ACLFRP_05965 [Puniceicoccaceae bacterium]
MKKDEDNSRADDVPPDVRRKAQRAIWILYAVMAFLILLPFLFLFFR